MSRQRQKRVNVYVLGPEDVRVSGRRRAAKRLCGSIGSLVRFDVAVAAASRASPTRAFFSCEAQAPAWETKARDERDGTKSR